MFADRLINPTSMLVESVPSQISHFTPKPL